MRPAAFKLSRVLVLLAALLISATACGSASATKPCWQQVTDDWTAHKLGSKTYAPSCYDQAIKHLGKDVFYYSNAVDEIHAAKRAAMQKDLSRTTAGVHSSDPGSGGPTTDSGGGGGQNNTIGPLNKALLAGSTSSDSLPLPLLILAGVALALVAAGAFGVVSRRRNGQ